jgi:hypothetical protein
MKVGFHPAPPARCLFEDLENTGRGGLPGLPPPGMAPAGSGRHRGWPLHWPGPAPLTLPRQPAPRMPVVERVICGRLIAELVQTPET